MKKQTLWAVIFFSLAFLSLLLTLSLSQRDNLYDSVIRIHVLANSDEKGDQEKKLLVRDSILSYAKENFTEGSDREKAKEVLTQKIPQIKKIAEETLQKEGCGAKVDVVLKDEYYPTRHYESFSLPAGNYLSLKVMIGEAQGQNWWCVLFPPICIGSATETESALLDAGMTKENVKTITKKKKGYKIRFKMLEVAEEARKKLERLF